MFKMRSRSFAQSELLSFFIFVLSSFLSIGFTHALDDIVGCGGFVEASTALSKVMTVKMDYSNIRIKLFTRDGVLKDSTECAPNGYYFLPIYDKGYFRLVLEGPEGWSFEPNEVDVQIGEDNQCKGGEDINFKLIGFSLTGKVLSSGKCESGPDGPAGVLVTLKSTSGDSSTRTTTTVRGGKYIFNNVFPGTYHILASHRSWSFSKYETSTTLNWGNQEVTESLLVSGYDIRGRVLADDEPVSGVAFLLYSEGNVPIDCPEVDITPPEGAKKPQCVAFSDDDGQFLFKNIPCGKFTLVPFYKGDHTTFDVVPAGVKVVIDKGSVILDQTFQVMGFSVIGRVVDQQGGGVQDVIIVVDGHIKALSGSEGFYKLEQVTSGSYDIEATKDHIFFDSLSGHRLSPNVARLPDLHVVSYHLCGRIIVDIPLPGINIKATREVILTHENGKIETRITDANGGYCFDVKPGKYQVHPQIKSEEKQGGLFLSPESISVQLTNKPKLDADFIQTRLTVSGKVSCIETPCDNSISVQLSSLNRQLPKATTTLGLSSYDDHSVFLFRDVLPGQYQVEINQDSWCWEQKAFEIDLREKEKSDLVFIQSGYVLTTQVTHDLPLTLKHVTDKSGSKTRNQANKNATRLGTVEKLHLVKGTNKHCLAKGGVYEISTDSCYRFSKGVYSYDTSSSDVLDLTVTQYFVNGSIVVDSSNNQAEITVDVRSSGPGKSPRTEHLIAVASPSSSTKAATYTFTYWAYVGEQMEIVPHSPLLLFYPQQHSFTLTRPECPPPIPAFHARPGLYLSGTVSPPLEGIHISVYVDEASKVKRETSGEALTVVQTDANGNYKAGPLYDDQTYRVLATKEGFHFKEDRSNPGHFRALKLGSVSITVFEESSSSKSSKPQKIPLPGVLLSLTGDDGYRNNSATQQDGQLFVSNLFPGDYFLRPLLKEYVFHPNTQTIKIREGETVDFSFNAVRVAYSVYGHVHSLNGEAEKFIAIEADSVTGDHHEETQSDANGDYRLRGLQPSRDYIIRIKPKKESKKMNPIERASPNQVSLSVETEDIRNADFVIFRKSATFDVCGVINTTSEWYSHLKIELIKVGETEKPSQTHDVGPTNFFDFVSLSKDSRYIVKLTTTLSDRIYDFQITQPLLIVFQDSTEPESENRFTETDTESETSLSSYQRVVVDGKSSKPTVFLQFEAKPKLVNQDIAQTPFFALFFGCLAFLAVIYHKKAIAITQLIITGKWRKIFEKSEDQDDFSIGENHKRAVDRKKRR